MVTTESRTEATTDVSSGALGAVVPPATVTAYSHGCRGNGHAELWTQPDGVHIPQLATDFADQVIGFLLAHPKR